MEDPDSSLSKAQILLTFVTSDELNIGEAINDVKFKDVDRMEEWFGLSGRQLEVGVIQINVILHDRRGDTSGASHEVNLIDGDIEEEKFNEGVTVLPPLSEEAKRTIYQSAKNMYPKAYNKVLEINSGNGTVSERSKVKWDKYCYRKTHIKSFELSEFEKIDCNSSGLERGKYLSADDTGNIKLFLTKCVREFVLKKLESKYIRHSMDLAERKKTVKKGFFGLFKKEEKIIMKGGKYVFTDLEKSVKEFADIAFTMGIYDVAYKEYKYLHDEVKKRSEFWNGLILEKMVYCLLVKQPGCPTRKELNQIGNYLVSMSSISYNMLHRLVRASCLLNYFIHVQYESMMEPNANMIVTLSN